MRVLVVDDEVKFLEATVERLQIRGFDAEGAPSGMDALGCLGRGSYDVVLLDVKMPGLGGLQMIRELKARWPDLPVILMTGGSTRGDAEEGMRLGAFDYITKPTHIDDLVGMLQTAAGQNRKVDDT
jgi:DNA-binding response OmpR family regulator